MSRATVRHGTPAGVAWHTAEGRPACEDCLAFLERVSSVKFDG